MTGRLRLGTTRRKGREPVVRCRIIERPVSTKAEMNLSPSGGAGSGHLLVAGIMFGTSHSPSFVRDNVAEPIRRPIRPERKCLQGLTYGMAFSSGVIPDLAAPKASPNGIVSCGNHPPIIGFHALHSEGFDGSIYRHSSAFTVHRFVRCPSACGNGWGCSRNVGTVSRRTSRCERALRSDRALRLRWSYDVWCLRKCVSRIDCNLACTSGFSTNCISTGCISGCSLSHP